jgi:hypothetical protein
MDRPAAAGKTFGVAGAVPARPLGAGGVLLLAAPCNSGTFPLAVPLTAPLGICGAVIAAVISASAQSGGMAGILAGSRLTGR